MAARARAAQPELGGLRLRRPRARAAARAEVADGQRRAGHRDDRLRDRQDLRGRLSSPRSPTPATPSASGPSTAAEYLADERVKSSQLLVKGKKLILRYRPLGLIGVIGPWNYPLTNSFGDCIPALMAGNSVILKPSEVTPLTSLLLAEGLRECGLPEDVLQIATGRGETGAALIEHVDMIMFTGSTRTGRKVAEAAARAADPRLARARRQGPDDRALRRRPRARRQLRHLLLDAERRPDVHLDRARLRRGARLRRVRRESLRESARAARRQARRPRLGRGRRDHVPAAAGDDRGPRRRRRRQGRARARRRPRRRRRAAGASTSRPCSSTSTTR